MLSFECFREPLAFGVSPKKQFSALGRRQCDSLCHVLIPMLWLCPTKQLTHLIPLVFSEGMY